MGEQVLDGRYRLLGEIGRGGMATVYRGVDLTSGRDVAIKVLLGALSPKRRERFLREGQVLGALRHAGIVAIHNAGEFQGRPYLVMELVHGARELADAWKGHGLEQRVAWLIEVGNALGAAHDAGVVHRDVKPSNVLIDRDGRARLTDFGVAVAGDQERLTRTGQLVGTPHWMAPEVFQGADSASPRSDVWSLGVLLYEALTNRLPFEGDTIHQLMGNLAHGYVTPRTLSREIPRDLETVCMCALSANPARRYPDGRAFSDDLARYLRGEPVQARRGWRKVRPASLILLLAALVGLSLVGVLAWKVMHLGSGDLPPPPPETDPLEDRRPAFDSVIHLDAAAVRGDALPTLEALQPWAIDASRGAVRLRFNGETSPQLRVPCRFDGATACELRARLRVLLLEPTNRVCLAFQRWDPDAEPVAKESEEKTVIDYQLGADNVQREALYVELVCEPNGTPFGRYDLRAGTQDEILWTAPLAGGLGPLRELELRLRFDPKQGVHLAATLDGRTVAEGDVTPPTQPKGEWLLRVGANLTYTPTTRYGAWRAGGAALASGRVDLLEVALDTADAGGVRILEADPRPRHELGRLGREWLRAEPDYATFDERVGELGRLQDQDVSDEELWLAGTARYLRNLSLGRRGLEEEAVAEWRRDFASYHVQGASAARGRLSLLCWRWAHDVACYDPVSLRALAQAYVRSWRIESPAEYADRLLRRGAPGTYEGQALQRYHGQRGFAARQRALAYALGALSEVRRPPGLQAQVAFQVGAYEVVVGTLTEDVLSVLPPRLEASLRLAEAVSSVAASGDLQRARAALEKVGPEEESEAIRATRVWLEQLGKPE